MHPCRRPRRDGRRRWARDGWTGPRTVAPIEDRTLLAIGLMLGAFLAFTGIDTCAKWLVLHGVAATEVAFVRYAVHLGIVVAIGVAAVERLVGDDEPRGG